MRSTVTNLQKWGEFSPSGTHIILG